MLTLVYSGGSMPLTPKAEPTTRIGTTGGQADPAGHAIRIAASLLDRGVERELRRYIGG